jgi:hydantoinase/carbamoylase family amidase
MPRLLERLDQLALIGADPAGGMSRLAFSADDIAARTLVAGWMESAGLTVEIDAAANLIGRRAGRRPDEPAIAIGSHLDTVKGGGRLDGAYGVVAAVEAAERCTDLNHPLTVVAFSNEEGTVAPPGFTGSKAIAGLAVDVGAVVDDREGTPVTLGEVIARAGGRPDAIGSCAWAPGSVAAFVELHIEQGPVLERVGAGVGVVNSITGRLLVDVDIVGRAGHAGTTPMEGRSDALLAAAHVVLAVREMAGPGGVRVATAGLIECKPNLHNVIAGSVTVGVDLRDENDARILATADRLETTLLSMATDQGVTISVNRGPLTPAVPSDRTLVSALEEVAHRHASRVMQLPSGASHDAQIMANLAPVAMLFVPSHDGLSHNANEYTAPADLLAGAAALVDAVQTLDQRL